MIRTGTAVWLILVTAILVLLVSIAVCVTLGPVHVPVGTVLEVIARRMRLVAGGVTVLDDEIVWQLRLPRVVAAAATGAGLALAGAVLQSLTRNALADPYLLGISGGGTSGAVTVIVFGASGFASLGIGAFLGAIGALLLVFLLAMGRTGGLATTRTVLAGVAVGQLCSAYTSFVVLVRGDSDAARRILSWTFGSLAGVRWTEASWLAVTAVLAVLVILGFASWLDALAFGEDSARTLGVPVTGFRWGLMIGTSLMTAVIVSVTGAIGFVGLVVPHLVRLVFGPAHRRLLPLTAVCGAILLVWADTMARTVLTDREVPIGVVTAAIGVPVFAILLRRKAGVAR
ncbi:FecCD family ABC transporter permease [Sciscionella sediminilitoris]|uniref:FecCD family ABC transporter permease n=1 Tax=Sciscionella sediminilitoris TaxID=1445613 RepID=UPI0004DEFC32|nr:iron chelate uptake ABC transporter family permease subunit [Sciscionella sp. SE31]